MIPVLYSPTETNFSTNGIGLLNDSITTKVTEELNGMLELELTYPITGIHFTDIVVNGVIKAEPEENADHLEPFRIYKISKPLNGVVTVYAQDLTYIANYIPVRPIASATRTAQAALDAIKAAAAETCPLYLETDLTTSNTFELQKPDAMRSVLGGVEGSFLDVYGGEMVCKYPYLQFKRSRGADRGIVIEYGKNMLDLLQEEDMSGIITGICPYAVYTTSNEGMTEEHVVTLTEKVLQSQYASVFPFHRTACIDLSGKFTNTTETITEAQLRTAGNEFLTANAVGVPRVSLEVSFVGVKNDESYIYIDDASIVRLGDTITIKFPALGIETKEKVVRTVYDVLAGRYESATIGKPVQDLATTIYNLQMGTDVFYG
jgi:phage minor structural protein